MMTVVEAGEGGLIRVPPAHRLRPLQIPVPPVQSSHWYGPRTIVSVDSPPVADRAHSTRDGQIVQSCSSPQVPVQVVPYHVAM